jgi:uncharacterized protein YjdB
MAIVLPRLGGTVPGRGPDVKHTLLLSLCALFALIFPSCAEPLPPTLDLTPQSQTLVVGQPLQLSVTRRFPGGPVEDVTAKVAYTTTDRAIATVNERGVVTPGTAPGSVIVKAFDTTSDAFAIGTFTVVPAQITAIDISPSPVAMARGTTRQFTAVARFNNGSTRDVTRDVLWSSGNTAVAIVGNTQFDKGSVVAVAEGDTTIIATDAVSQVQGRSMVFVERSTVVLVSIVVTPNPALVAVGKTLEMSALGVYSDGSSRNLTRGSGVTWTSSRPDLATVDTNGVVTGVLVGDATITAAAPEPTTAIKGSAAAKVVP